MAGYRHIQEYEEEMLELKAQGMTVREIGERYGLTQSYGITPSMSRRGNPYDNALAEYFFSILKTECIYCTKPRTYEEARLLIGDYIHFYNYQRIQLKTKLTSMEYRCQFVT